ncbi:DUF599 domain-containing protein [Roseobacteraceae bacterium S113]
MTWIERISLFGALDAVAVALLFSVWIGMNWLIDNSGKRRSVSQLMAEYRREWMRQMTDRDNRIFDSQTMAMLRQGTAFFASACMIAIGGTFALIGNADLVAGLGNDLLLSNTPAIVWEFKLVIVLFFLTNAFLKFVWANRLFGYCAVLVASVPNDPKDPRAVPRASQAGEINITAARSFNRGLRAIYFSMATLAWLFGPLVLLIATAFTMGVLWRREFASHSRAALLAGLDMEPK